MPKGMNGPGHGFRVGKRRRSLRHFLARSWFPFGLTAALLSAVWLPSAGAFDGFLRLDGISGKSTDPRHAGWIDVTAAVNGVKAAAGSNALQFQLIVSKRLDRASPVLDLFCAQGKRIRTGQLDFVQPDGNRVRFYQLGFTNVTLLRISAEGQAQGANPMPAEDVQLSFQQITWTYTEIDQAGFPKQEQSAWWDIARNIGGIGIPEDYFRVSATQDGDGSLVLSWPGKAGTTNVIRAAASVTGPYSFLMEVPVDTNGTVTQRVPAGSGAQFFIIER